MGRPRVYPPGTTASERARLAVQARLAEGEVRLNYIVSAEAAAALSAIAERTGETKRAVVERLLLREAKRKSPGPP